MDAVREFVRDRWRVLLAAGLALLLVGAIAIPRIPQARADPLTDPCGTEPEFWEFSAWASWEYCEITNGETGDPTISQVTNPLFQGFIDALNTGTDGIITAIHSIPGPVGSAFFSGFWASMNTFFLPTPGDFDTLTAAITAIGTHAPFDFIGTVATNASALESQWETASSGFSAPSNSGGAPGGTGSDLHVDGADLGVLSAGVIDWLYFMHLCGIDQSLFSDLFSGFIVITTAWSIIGDIGVKTGYLGPTGKSD